MIKELEEFTKAIGVKAATHAVETYKKAEGARFRDSWRKPMMYASGFTAGHITKSLANKWIVPLRNRLRAAWIGLAVATILLVFAGSYLWYVLDFVTFLRFLVLFVPGIAALAFSIAKTYKIFTEARKTLAEARQLEIATSIEPTTGKHQKSGTKLILGSQTSSN